MPSALAPAMEKPLWSPGQDRLERANLSRFMRFVREEVGNADLNSYAPLYRFSIDRPEQFWTLLWDFVGIRGSGERTPVCVQDEGMAKSRWFPGVSLNFTQNLLRFDDDRVAIRRHRPGGEDEQLTYAQLQRRVAAFAAAMRARGLVAGDIVAARLPATADAMVAMLASASIGVTWLTLPREVSAQDAEALAIAAPKMLLCMGADRDAAAMPGLPVFLLDDDSLLAGFEDAEADHASLPFDHPLYLTFTGHDGRRELLVHGAGGTLIQHLKELVLHADLRREDKVFFHAGTDSFAWYWLASALATGATLVLNGGDEFPPDSPALWDLVDECGISVLGVHSEWLDACAQAGQRPVETHRLMSLKTVLTAGAPLSAATYDFTYAQVKPRLLLAPVSTGGDTLACFALGAPVLPVYRGEIPCRALGMKVEVLAADGQAVVGEQGDLCCSAPFPSMPLGFVGDEDGARYGAAYFSRHPGRWSRGERATLTARESLIPG